MSQCGDDDYFPPDATNRFDGQDFPPGPRQEPEMAQATVIEPDDIFGSAAVAEAFPEYDFSDLTAKQIKELSNYGAILDKLSPDQIAEVLALVRAAVRTRTRMSHYF